MSAAEILDRVTLLLAKATEAQNGTARSRDGEELNGFVLDHHDYMAMHCLLNLERFNYDLNRQQALHEGGFQKVVHNDG